MMKKTPPILTNGTFEEYFEAFNDFYNGVDVKYPETGENIGIYIGNESEVMHYICGKGKTDINYARAQKLLWIKFLIEEIELRDVFLENDIQNILFVSLELNYIVIVGNLTKSKNNRFIQERKLVTTIVKNKNDIERMYSDPRYTILHK